MPTTSTAFQLSQRARRTGSSPISHLMAEAIYNPGVISLAAGFVDGHTLPAAETAQLMERVLSDTAQGRLPRQYDTTKGRADLRRLLVDHLAALDGVSPAELDASPDDVVITNGSQQLLFILTDILVDPGDIVICGWPSYFVYTGALATFGAQVRGVAMDADGMIPEALDETLAHLARSGDLPRVKIVYIVDYHQNPTGITLSEARRPRILEIVQRYSAQHRILLMEDAAYRELTFEGEPPPSIKRFDEGNETVALLQTFSKPFAPGVRTGYGLLPRDLVDPVVLQKGNHDFGSSHLNQHLVKAAMESGLYAEHVKSLCAAYATKRDALLAALDRHLGDFEPDATHWTRPTGGMYVWLTLPDRFDTGRDGPLFSAAVAEGVLYVPGAFCYGPDPTRDVPTNQMRVSFGLATAEQIEEGVARLARAIRSVG